MKRNALIMLLLCLLHSILFYKLEYGLNAILFTVPMLLFLLFEFKNNKVKNKKGLLLMIPIVILSSTYLIYDNNFNNLNMIVIPLLYILMYLVTLNPTNKIGEFIDRFVKIIVEPFGFVEKFYKLIKKDSKKVEKLDNRKIKSYLLVLPIVLLVILLLASADMMFDELLGNITKIVKELSLIDLVPRIFGIIILFSYMGAQLYYLKNDFIKKEEQNVSKKIKIDSYTIKVLLTSLNIIYLIFDIIQIKGLLLHKLPSGITYASYARRGFFQLVIISIINIFVILISKFSDDNKYNKGMSIFMVLLTLVIISSSFFRMYLYESAYGYTISRLLVYVVLITEVIIFIPTIMYILNSKVNIVKWYMVIIISIYTGINLVSFDYIIASNNINRYYKKDKIDIEYLKNYEMDNIPLLVELYNNSDNKIQKELDEYFKFIKDDNKIKDFREYNISKEKGLEQLEKIYN